MSLNYEPVSEPLHVSVKWLSVGRGGLSGDEDGAVLDCTRQGGDLTRTSICDNYSGAMNVWIVLVIVKQDLVQIGRIDGPTEYLS